MSIVRTEQDELSAAEKFSTEQNSEQYLTFIMNGEEYGVDILSVQEIRGWATATPLPNAPPHIKGVINLRGNIVPIVDLRLCFGMTAISYTNITVVIVLRVESRDDKERIIGIVVDGVSDVHAITRKEMKDAPDLGDSVDTSYIKGLVSINEKMVILLNLDQLLTLDELPDLPALRTELLH